MRLYNKHLIQLYKLVIVIAMLYVPCFGINAFLNVIQIKNPSPGNIFISDAIVDNAIVNNYGRAIDSIPLSKIKPGLDFRIQANGAMTFADTRNNKFYKLNSQYKIVDSFQVANNLETDFHEFLINPDGSYYMIANKYIIVDLSEKVQNGKKDAKVIEQIIQKFNANKELVWSFSLYDNFSVLDATNEIDLTQQVVDPYHLNSIDDDQNGNIYISLRSFTQIIKINVPTSTVVWRLGGSKSKNNQFTFLNDEIEGFTGNSNTHDVKILPNGNLLFVDNGNVRPDPFTRVVEYKINESAKTVEKVWEFIPSPRIFASIMGSVQRLENGNNFISLGNDLFEVNKNGEVVFKAVKLYGSTNYRTYKFPYKINMVHLSVNNVGNYDFNKNGNNTFAQMNLQYANAKGYINLTRHDYKPQRYAFNELEPSRIINQRWVIESDIDFASKISFDVKNFSDYNKTDSLVSYARDNEDRGEFKKIVSTFNKATGIITIDISKDCEFIITSNDQIINSTPELTLPRNNEIVNTNVSFKWTPIQYATQYEFELSDQNDFKNIIFSSVSLTTTSTTVSNLINGRTYLWRVRAKSGASISQWSDVWNLKVIIATPNLVYPEQAAKSIKLNDVLRWNQILQSSYYDIQIAKDNAFTQVVFDVKGYLDSSVTLNYLANRTDYFWRVRAGNLESVTTWSAVKTFRTELKVPNVIYPTNNSNAIPVNLNIDFEKSKEADYYQVLIAEDDNFFNAKSINVASNQINAKFDLEHYKSYVAKVRSISYLDTSRWSDIVYFKTIIQKPTLKYPLRFMLLVPVPTLFIVEEVKDAISYELNIISSFTDKLPKDDVILDTTFSSNSFNILVPFLEKKTTNKWRARTIYQYGESEWTDFNEFSLGTAGILNPPSLSKPLNMADSESLNGIMSWDNTANEDANYRLILSENESFENILTDEIIYDKKHYYKNLINNKTYFWKVAAFKDGEFSDWTATWQFTTKKIDLISTPKLILPENNSEIKTTNVDFVWEKLAFASVYNLQISKDKDFNLIEMEESSFPGYNYSIYNPTPNTEYYWRVRAIQKDSSKAGMWSDVYRFKMAAELSSVEVEETLPVANFMLGKDYILRDIKGGYVALTEILFKDVNDLKLQLASGVYFLIPTNKINRPIKLIK